MTTHQECMKSRARGIRLPASGYEQMPTPKQSWRLPIWGSKVSWTRHHSRHRQLPREEEKNNPNNMITHQELSSFGLGGAFFLDDCLGFSVTGLLETSVLLNSLALNPSGLYGSVLAEDFRTLRFLRHCSS